MLGKSNPRQDIKDMKTRAAMLDDIPRFNQNACSSKLETSVEHEDKTNTSNYK